MTDLEVFGDDSMFSGFTAETFFVRPDEVAVHQHLLDSDPTYKALAALHREVVTHNPVFNPLRIVAKGLKPHITEEAVTAYFANFGPVESCIIKSNGKETYALVKFVTRKATNSALSHSPHMIQMVPVQVTRACNRFS